MKKIINNELVDLTSEELQQIELDKQNEINQQELLNQKKLDEEAKKTSGKQKLLDLGLTEEEVKVLIGL